jgi:short-subunit dehydrogenase
MDHEARTGTAAPTLVVAGVGPGLGMALTRRFGADGFRVGLVARRASALDEYVAELRELGVEAAAAPADLAEPAQLATAFGALRSSLGPVDVLVFSPMPDLTSARCVPSRLMAELARRLYETQTLAAVGCVQQVLPGMLERGRGSLFLTTGTSAMVPLPAISPLGMAHAAIRSYALVLREELAASGIDVHHVTIRGGIGTGAGQLDPAALAERYAALVGTAEVETILAPAS